VPANIDVEKTIKMMKAGLGTIKFAIDALDDDTQKKIRGKKNDFTNSYKKICELLEYKAKDSSIKTQISVTMIELAQYRQDAKVFEGFMKLWQGKDVYVYVKSQDNRWFHDQDPKRRGRSHYELQYCEFPWTSLTVMADGSVVPCTQDYNCEMVMGNAGKQSLEEIWNSDTYDRFRRWHIEQTDVAKYKCDKRCDIKRISERLKEKGCGISST
jgi:radical SAM protein with 4Fe4S-binding SPASM domain